VSGLGGDELARVVGGGDSSTTIKTPVGSAGSSRSDLGLCVSQAHELAAQQFPDTRPLPLPFWTDDNKGSRAAAARNNVDTMCIGGSGGGSAGFR
jgi:hypothetical protein